MITVLPLQLGPATVNHNYTQPQPFLAIGGVAPYTFSVTGNLPIGMILNGASLLGSPAIADQYNVTQSNFAPGAVTPNTYVPIIVNPSTFTITATDSLGHTGSQVYTLPVGIFTESQAISISEMLRASYDLDWYIAMSSMGTRNMRIGDIGNAGEGGLRLMINAMLSMFTIGMQERLKQYIHEWDKLKLLCQTQTNGGVQGITGVNMVWENKKKLLLELVKTILPAYTLNEIRARDGHGGGSDSISGISGNGGGGGIQIGMR